MTTNKKSKLSFKNKVKPIIFGRARSTLHSSFLKIETSLFCVLLFLFKAYLVACVVWLSQWSG
jgi:hypothetical protein